jgi:DNA-binding MarR family transcriptional regulator
MHDIELPRALEQSLGFNLDRTAMLFRRELLRALARDGLLPEQWQVLSVLADAGPLSQQQLADVLLADKHAMSRTLTRMERNGWVARERSVRDFRAQVVRPTPKASRRLGPMRAAVRQRFRQRLATLPGEDADRLLSLLRQLRALLKDTP